MPEAAVQEILTENFVEASAEKENISCLTCGNGKMRRVHRDGFLQTIIFPLLGYYPWRCTRCGEGVMLRKRHRTKIQIGGTGDRI